MAFYTNVKFAFLFAAFSLFAIGVNAQVKIGGSMGAADSNAYLQLGDSNSANKGLLLPRVALLSSTSASPLSAHIAGMTVYNTATINDVTSGFYYNDGTKWLRSDNASSPWFNASTGNSAESNTDNIYQMGKVGVGVSTPATQLHVGGTDGIVVPVGTTAQRPAVPVTGTLRFNTSLNKFEAFDGNSWQPLN